MSSLHTLFACHPSPPKTWKASPPERTRTFVYTVTSLRIRVPRRCLLPRPQALRRPARCPPALQCPPAMPGAPNPPAGNSGSPRPASGRRGACGRARGFIRAHGPPVHPATLNMRPGDTVAVGLEAQNVRDLFSIPLLVQYDPAVIQIDDVRNGGFLSGGTQEIAIVQQCGSTTRSGHYFRFAAAGNSGHQRQRYPAGSGVRAIGPGNASLQIVQVNARDSQQRNLPLSVGEAKIQVK